MLTIPATAAADPSTGVQTADQSAGSEQGAVATSQAAQIDPSNTNISIRVFSDGNDGSVEQSNTVSSDAEAENENETKQDADQSQAGAGGIQTSDQTAYNGQLAAAYSTALQFGASNTNLPIRVGSDGSNGSVEQSNEVSSEAEAENENETKQDADQSQAGGTACCAAGKAADQKSGACCATAPGVQTADQKAVNEQAAGAKSAAVQKGASNVNLAIRVGSEGDGGSVTQTNAVSSKAEAENENETKQDADQSQAGGSGIQATDQVAGNKQVAGAASTAVQEKPRNVNISIRVLSDGNDGNVRQSNEVSSKAEADNENETKQDADQTIGSGDKRGLDAKNGCCTSQAGIQTAEQHNASGQFALAGSAATQNGAKNVNMPIRVGSDGGNGSVEQSNEVSSKAEAENENETKQDADQTIGSGDKRGLDAKNGCCASQAGIQTAEQANVNLQGATAFSVAAQDGAKNVNSPIRVKSDGNDGSVEQSNEVSSEAEAENENETKQDADQTIGSGDKRLADLAWTDGKDGKGDCCQSGTGVQTAEQANLSVQAATAFSLAKQEDAKNANSPIRVKSDGNDGSVEQSNDVSSEAEAENENETEQDVDQGQSGGGAGLGVQVAYQTSLSGQIAAAASGAFQFGASNSNDPVRVKSDGGGGSVKQSNDVSSEAEAENENETEQDADQWQKGGGECRCKDAIGIQVTGQKAVNEQAAKAASIALQDFGKSECGCKAGGNSNGGLRVLSEGDDGRVEQSNDVSSEAEAENENETEQKADQKQGGGSGIGIQVLGQKAWNGQAAVALSAAAQLGARNSNHPLRVKSDGGGGSVKQSNDVSSEAEAENENETEQKAGQFDHRRPCGCADGLGVQVLGQSATSVQVAKALSEALQKAPANSNKPASVWSDGGGGRVDQGNEADSDASSENENELEQFVRQLQL
jgi:hypothetical protein